GPRDEGEVDAGEEDAPAARELQLAGAKMRGGPQGHGSGAFRWWVSPGMAERCPVEVRTAARSGGGAPPSAAGAGARDGAGAEDADRHGVTVGAARGCCHLISAPSASGVFPRALPGA